MNEIPALLADGEVRKEVITIRKRTRTREPIRLVVSQVQDKKGNLTICTITLEGEVSTSIESPRFARDYGGAWIHAGMIADRWNQYVNGIKR